MSGLITRARVARLAGYLSVQVVVQVLGFVAGIVLVRHMAQAEYGYYALAISMVGVANVLFDLGLGTAVLAVGGAAMQHKAGLGGVVDAAYSLQRHLSVAGCVVLLPVFAAMFAGQGLGAAHVAALSVLAIACSVINARNQVALSVARLRGDLALQQRLEIGVNVGKLLLILAAVSIYIDARIAVAANVVAAALMYFFLHRYVAGERVGGGQKPPAEPGSALRRFVKQQAPNSLYYCFSGQIAIWLVGLHGSSERVAEVGALGRLAMVFTLIGAVVTALVQPYFARIERRHELVAGFATVNGMFVLLTAALTGLAVAAPGLLLWILGPQYAALNRELIWMVLSASLAAWSGAVYSIGAARGWVVPSYWVLPVGCGTLAAAIWLIDVSTVIGSFQMNTASAAAATLLVIIFVGSKLHSSQHRSNLGGAQ